MASLKEIRSRISSVTNTRKITSAMKMVSSAKLHKAQNATIRFQPYWAKISGILSTYLSSNDGADLGALTVSRDVKQVVIVAFSSNSSLCGAFNSNVQKKLDETLAKYAHLPQQNIKLYLVGKKIYEAFTKKNTQYTIEGPFIELADKPNYESINEITNLLMNRFFAENVDKVELVYNKFKSTGVQIISNEGLLPITLPEANEQKISTDYIIEPNQEHLIKVLVPTVVRLHMYGALLNSYTSEHGARTTAMQIATDNADELLEALVLQYNRLRQDAITNEILDIVGGAEALR